MMRSSVLIIVDMINGFVNEGPLADKHIETISPNIKKLIQHYKLFEQTIIAVHDQHQPHSTEFEAFPVHCLKDTNESQLISSLAAYEKDILILPKNSVNAFHSEAFQAWFKLQSPEQDYVITGCVTDICVLSLAMTLKAYFHEHNFDNQVFCVEDAVATFDTPDHPRQIHHDMALALMKQSGVQIIKTVDLL